MLFTSPVYSQASGSIAGLVYSHNRGGMYTRARTTPTDPGSSRQMILRAAVGSLAPTWAGTLNDALRQAWRNYASNVAMVNALGETVFLSGQQHYMRCNIPRIQVGLAVKTAAPTTFDLGTFTAPTISEANDDRETSISFDNTDDWASTDGGALLCYHGNPQGAGINFYKSPWKYAGKVDGSTATPPTSPNVFTPPVEQVAGQKIWTMIRIMQVDGRYSLPIILGPETVVAAP